VRPDEPLLQAIHEMRKRNVGCVIVVERRGERVVPVGILTDRDIVGVLPEKAAALETASVAECMSARPLTLAEDESIVDAMARLRQRGGARPSLRRTAISSASCRPTISSASSRSS
jgi:CBS domain-containing protein